MKSISFTFAYEKGVNIIQKYPHIGRLFALCGALAHCREAAQAYLLPEAGFKVAVAALADENGRFVGLFYPMAVLLKGLGGALGLDVFARSVRQLSLL